MASGLLGLLLLLGVAACNSDVVPQASQTAPPTPVHTDLEGSGSPAATNALGPDATPGPASPAASPPATSGEPAATAAPTPEPSAAAATPTPSAAPTPAATPAPTPTPTPEPSGPPPSPGPIAADQKPCPTDIADGWSCVQLTVPLDHFHDTGRTTDVTFALKRHTAKGPALGTWVTITGGPGTAGIYSAVSYTDTFAPEIRQRYDLVFMDQRGSGMSDSFTCPNAALALYTDPAGPADQDGGAALDASSKTFVEACLSELKVDPTTLPYYATRQAVEDLEAFRLWLGVDKLSLYGESYGTQYVQTYAAAHPDAVKVLFTDGPVDLATSGEAFYVEGVKAYEDALAATLFDCTTQVACTRDVIGGNESTTYDALAAQLADAPLDLHLHEEGWHQGKAPVHAHRPSDGRHRLGDQRGGSELLQRAMVAASRGQVWWLARLDYAGLGQDPDTLAAIPDPSYSDALYYAVECVDYAYFPDAGDTDARAEAYLAYGEAHGLNDSDMASDYYGDLPCVYWPAQPGPDPRPVAAPDAPYPHVVLGATLDPTTPFPNAQRIVARRTSTAGTWLIYQPGGPHIIYGRGNRCPDDLVTRILVNGVFPAQHTTVCPGDVADDYVHVPAADPRDEGSTLNVLRAIDDEINAGVDYQYWDGVDPLVYGCPFGGTITYTPRGVGSRLNLNHCAFYDGLRTTGSGIINDKLGTFVLRVTFNGDGTSSRLRYDRDAKGASFVSGGELHFTAPVSPPAQ